MDAFWNILFTLGSAAVLGGFLGFERELNNRGAGLRTHMMVALGASLFTLTGLAVVGDNSRAELVHVIQGLATGIGFIGAGTILKLTDRLEILGLTTASSIWLAAAVGTACGLQHYAMAAAAVVLSLVILAVLGQLEKLLHSGGTGTSRHDESATPGKVNDVPVHQSSSKQLSA